MTSINRRRFVSGTAAAATGLATAQRAFAAEYGPGASATEIKVGQFGPLSGPASSFGIIAKAMRDYFRMINDAGGINGRKVTFINYDDGYAPPKSVEAARRLVESDEVLLIAGAMGTPGNMAVQKYMNTKKVPQILLAAGTSRLSNPSEFPWTMVGGSTFAMEGAVVGRYLNAQFPDAKIGYVFQNDEAGKEIVAGLKSSLGARASQIVSEQTYDVTDTTIDSQIINIRAAKADILYLITIPKFASQALKSMAGLQWRPHTILSQGNASTKSTLVPAGLENVQGVVTFTTRQDPANPIWADDPSMKEYKSFAAKFGTENDVNDDWYAFGYGAAVTTTYLLGRCGDVLTRENVMRQMTSLQGYPAPMQIPGITMNTSPTDYVPVKQFQLMRFKGQAYERVGSVISAV
jgi:branched-chain amino acid transport system substrate-binding protein